MNLRIREVLLNSNTGEIRATFEYKGILWIVKVFDPDFPENVSVKLFDRTELYEKTKSFWNTKEVISNGDLYKSAITIANRTLYRYIGRLCN